CLLCPRLFSYYLLFSFSFFFTATPPTEIYTLSLHDALPISVRNCGTIVCSTSDEMPLPRVRNSASISSKKITTGTSSAAFSLALDRKSTRLNFSHGSISYAVFCLKKKNKQKKKNK